MGPLPASQPFYYCRSGLLRFLLRSLRKTSLLSSWVVGCPTPAKAKAQLSIPLPASATLVPPLDGRGWGQGETGEAPWWRLGGRGAEGASRWRGRGREWPKGSEDSSSRPDRRQTLFACKDSPPGSQPGGSRGDSGGGVLVGRLGGASSPRLPRSELPLPRAQQREAQAPQPPLAPIRALPAHVAPLGCLPRTGGPDGGEAAAQNGRPGSPRQEHPPGPLCDVEGAEQSRGGEGRGAGRALRRCVRSPWRRGAGGVASGAEGGSVDSAWRRRRPGKGEVGRGAGGEGRPTDGPTDRPTDRPLGVGVGEPPLSRLLAPGCRSSPCRGASPVGRRPALVRSRRGQGLAGRGREATRTPRGWAGGRGGGPWGHALDTTPPNTHTAKQRRT